MTDGLVLTSVQASAPGLPLLHDASLTAPPGSVTMVAGPNGSGIATLFGVVEGSIPITAGRIELDGRAIGELPRGTISSVPEGRRLFPSLSVEENLVLAADVWRIRGAERERRLQETWSRFEALANARHRAARTLSGGQQQQLAIARALLAAPRVLILAEPSSGLSPLAWSLVRDACRAAATEGRIVLVAEQRLRLAAEVADRCALLHSGRVSFEGPTEVALERALTTDYFGLGDA